MLSPIIAIVGFSIIAIGMKSYFEQVKRQNTPVRPIALITALVTGITANLLALWEIQHSSTLAVFISLPIALISLAMAASLLFALSKSKTPMGNIQVAVGDKVLPFTAVDDHGQHFSSQQFEGKRVLLKFYRGSWCPYCSMELKMFEQMKPLFDQYHVELFGVSNDTHEQAKAHIERDQLSISLVSDPNLEVIRRYGVEHHKALGGDSANMLKMFGLSFPTMMRIKAMSIPTTLLIDEHGVIRWIDQSQDVRLRASQETLERALIETFDCR